jgi:Outer membrane protein beta-barrel domain
MRLVTAILVGALFAGGSAAAQDISGGVKGGVNFANLKFDGKGADINLDTRVGLVAGAFVTWPVTPRFDIQPEALVSVKGASISEAVGDVDVELTYLEIPVLFRYRAPVSGNTSLQLFAGPSPAFKLNAEVTGEFFDISSDQDIDDEIETFDFGLVIGAGIEIGHVTLDGRYTWGLSDLNADPESPEVEVRNRVFSILVGFRF